MFLSGEIEAHQEAYLALELAASRPYNNFVYADREQAEAVHRYLLRRGAEYAPPFGKLLLRGGEVLGMIAFLTGAELSRARLKAAYALSKMNLSEDVKRRTIIAGRALLKPGPEDVYLSRIASTAKGAGDVLMQHLLERAGRRRIALEVTPDSAKAVALYTRHGFRPVNSFTVTDQDSELTYLHMERPCDSSTG